MKLFSMLLASLAIGITSTASADEDEARTTTSLSDIRLYTGTGMLFSDKDGAAIQRYNVYFMPRLSFHDRLYIAPRVNLSTIDLSLRQPRDLPLDVDLSLPWQMSLGFDLRYRHPLLRWLDLTIFYQFEFPTSSNKATIDAFALHRQEDAPDVNITLDQAQERISVVHTWRHFALGATLTAHVGWWHPFIDVGYLSTVGRLAVDFDPGMTELLRAAKVNPDRFYDTSIESVYYSAGSEFDLGKHFRIRTQATVIILDDAWIVNADTALVIPIGITN